MLLYHSENPKQGQFTCDYCGVHLRQSHTLTEHIQMQHLQAEVQPWECMHCEFKCKRKSNLAQHLVFKHKMKRSDAVSDIKMIDLDAVKARYPGIVLK